MFQLTCMAGELARALSLASQVSGREKQVPILRAVRIDASKKGATFSATNMDHGVRVNIAAEGSGTAYVETALIEPKAAALRSDQPVSIAADKDGKFITVTQGKTRWRVPILLGDGFPDSACSPISGNPVQVPSGPLFAAIDIAKEAINPGLANSYDMGALFDMQDGFRIVSTTSKKFSIVQIDAPVLPVSFILPNSAMAVIGHMFRASDVLAIIATPDAITVTADDVMYKTKLIEQKYADWRKALAKQVVGLDGQCVISARELIETINRASMIAEDKTKDGAALGVRVHLAEGEFLASAKNRSNEEGSDACAFEGDAGDFVVSALFLRQMVGTMSSDKIRIRFAPTDPEKPIAIYQEPAGALDNFRIVMPMRA